MSVIELLELGVVWTREQLCRMTERDDRTIRDEIRSLRRKGYPIFAVKGGGYKIATNESERNAALHQMRGRALDMLSTYSKMAKAMNVDGAQLTLAEIAEAMQA